MATVHIYLIDRCARQLEQKNNNNFLFTASITFLFFFFFFFFFFISLSLGQSTHSLSQAHCHLSSQAHYYCRPVHLKLTLVQLASFSFSFFHFIKSSLIHSLYFTVSSHLKPLKLTLSTLPPRPSSTSPPSSSSDPRRRFASTHFSSADPLQVSLCLLHVDALGF